jgi:hypothetical protein
MTPVIELRVKNHQGVWTFAGSVSVDEPVGSISSDDAEGTNIYLFGWHDGTPGVWESVGGAHVENSAVRQVITLGMELLCDLTEEPYEMTIIRAGQERHIRFALGEA